MRTRNQNYRLSAPIITILLWATNSPFRYTTSTSTTTGLPTTTDIAPSTAALLTTVPPTTTATTTSLPTTTAVPPTTTTVPPTTAIVPPTTATAPPTTSLISAMMSTNPTIIQGPLNCVNYPCLFGSKCAQQGYTCNCKNRRYWGPNCDRLNPFGPPRG